MQVAGFTTWRSAINMPASKKNILLFGGSCLLGNYISNSFLKDKLIKTYYKKNIPGGLYFDACKPSFEGLEDIAKTCSHAIILIANSNPDNCFRDIVKSTELNVESIKRIIDFLHFFRVIPVFSSTESVFDGTRGNYREDDSVSPIYTYGMQKAEIENYLVKSKLPYLIVRLSRLVSDVPSEPSIFSSWLSQINQNQDIRCAVDHIFSPIHVFDASNYIAMLVDKSASGIYHISGVEGMARIEMLNILVKIWRSAGNPYAADIFPCKMRDFDTEEPRPLNISMNPQKILNFSGIAPRKVSLICQSIVENSMKR